MDGPGVTEYNTGNPMSLSLLEAEIFEFYCFIMMYKIMYKKNVIGGSLESP